jgi:hypothetical protein
MTFGEDTAVGPGLVLAHRVPGRSIVSMGSLRRDHTNCEHLIAVLPRSGKERE